MLTIFVFICYKCNLTWKNRQFRNEELKVYKFSEPKTKNITLWHPRHEET